MAFNKGIPGNYEDFSYLEAKKVMEDIKRNETLVMNKLRLGLAKRMFSREVTDKLEQQIEQQELDKIFKMDYSESEGEKDTLSTVRTGKNSSSNALSSKNNGSDSSDEIENVEEGFESTRKNNVEEDMRVAQTII